MRKLVHLGLPLVAAVSACGDFATPTPENPMPILGCYVSSGAPTFEVGSSQLRVVGTQIAVPYTYERRKVGMTVRAALNAEIIQGEAKLVKGNEHLFRVSFLEGAPTITIAFGEVGEVFNFHRVASDECAA